MPVWLTLLGGVVATLGFLGAVFGVIAFLIEGKKAKGKPSFGFFSTGAKGTVGAWVKWDPGTYDVGFYRFRFQRISPEMAVKESQFTVSYENPQKASFAQIIQLPPEFAELLSDPKARAIVSVEARSTEEYVLTKTMTLPTFRKICARESSPPDGTGAPLEAVGADAPAVTSLDFSELQERKKRLKALEAAASAKAAKAAPKPAAAGKPAAAPTPSP